MNRAVSSILSASLLFACAAVCAPDARACAVLTPDESVPVTGHKMILSLSQQSTTLWDQFSYTGAPESFGWLLPIKGQVEVGLSSDALFDTFGQVTAPQVFAPAICPNSCDGNGGGGGGSFGGGVEVIAHESVGPFDTVQLASNDPNALYAWLTANGFPVPAGVKPVLDTYVTEGFGFLALKLLPGATTEAIQPVRITMPGAAPSFPLRLLAAGTGDLTQVTLWVVSEGQYYPENADVVTIDPNDVVWDFATSTSNYDALRTAALTGTDNKGYVLEQSRVVETWEIQDPLTFLISSDPGNSGYGATAPEAQLAYDADMDALLGSFGASPWVTRVTADLSRAALANDLTLTATPDQIPYSGTYNPTNYINAGECPPDPCGGSGGAGAGGNGAGGSGTGGNGTGAGNTGGSPSGGSGEGANADDGGTGSCNCSLPGSPQQTGAAFSLVFALGLALRRARRRRG